MLLLQVFTIFLVSGAMGLALAHCSGTSRQDAPGSRKLHDGSGHLLPRFYDRRRTRRGGGLTRHTGTAPAHPSRRPGVLVDGRGVDRAGGNAGRLLDRHSSGEPVLGGSIAYGEGGPQFL